MPFQQLIYQPMLLSLFYFLFTEAISFTFEETDNKVLPCYIINKLNIYMLFASKYTQARTIFEP